MLQKSLVQLVQDIRHYGVVNVNKGKNTHWTGLIPALAQAFVNLDAPLLIEFRAAMTFSVSHGSKMLSLLPILLHSAGQMGH